MNLEHLHRELEQIAVLKARIAVLDDKIAALTRQDDTSRRLMNIPGVGPICAAAVHTFSPPMETFLTGRDFSAWLGLTPCQHSTGGKERLGKVSKMGQRDLRRLLISGAMALVRWAVRKGAPEGSWLQRMLSRKHRMLVAVALANKMARTIWALIINSQEYRPSGV